MPFGTEHVSSQEENLPHANLSIFVTEFLHDNYPASQIFDEKISNERKQITTSNLFLMPS